MKRLLPLAALCILLLGCGKTTSTQTVTRTVTVPPSAIRVAPCTTLGPPCSAITPEGARGADKSHYYNPPSVAVVYTPPAPLTLTGSEIQLDPFGASFVEGFENIYEAWYCPYYDPYGHVWSRAFGETDWSGNFGGVCISHEQAERNVIYLMDTQYLYTVRDLDVSLNHHQVDALASFVWNLGPGSMGWQPLRSELQRHDPYGMLGYDIAGGQVLSGLAERRRREVALFLEPDHEAPPETPVQRRRREERELAGHKQVLGQLRVQVKHLREKDARFGCYRREKAHMRLGVRCEGWKQAGDRVGRHGRLEDAQIKRLETALR